MGDSDAVREHHPVHVLFDHRGATLYNRAPHSALPDMRDGLTHLERIVRRCLHALHKARGSRQVPTGILYGSVVEESDMRVEERQRMLVRRVGHL
jgi:hypothetical protein